MNLPTAVPSEDYVPPEDVEFEQVWDPSLMLSSSEGAPAPPDPGVLVEEFVSVVSEDKVRVITAMCSALRKKNFFSETTDGVYGALGGFSHLLYVYPQTGELIRKHGSPVTRPLIS